MKCEKEKRMEHTDSELQVTGDDTGLLVVASGVTGQLEDLSGEVLENGGEVDRSTGTNTLSVVALAQETVNTTDGEGETGLGRTAVQTESENAIAIDRKRSC